MMFVWR